MLGCNQLRGQMQRTHEEPAGYAPAPMLAGCGAKKYAFNERHESVLELGGTKKHCSSMRRCGPRNQAEDINNRFEIDQGCNTKV